MNGNLLRSVLKISSGHNRLEHCVSFLEQYFSNRIPELSSSVASHGLFLNSDGRIVADAIVSISGEKMQKCIYIDTARECSESLLQHLNFYGDFSDEAVNIEEIPRISVYAVLNKSENKSVSSEPSEHDFLVCDPRPPLQGLQRLYHFGTRENSKSLRSKLHSIISPRDYDLLRFKAGVPECPHEIRPNKSFPTQCNYDLINGIDFEKGCYLGQELTSRTHFVGKTRRRILPFKLLKECAEKELTQIDYKQQPINFYASDSENVAHLLNYEGGYGLALHRSLDKVKHTGKQNAFMVIGNERYEVEFYLPKWWPEKF